MTYKLQTARQSIPGKDADVKPYWNWMLLGSCTTSMAPLSSSQDQPLPVP